MALRWLKSSRCFAFHIGVFALGITIALAINVARDPGTLWVDRMAIGWALILLVHAMVVALIFAIGLLGSSEQRLPVYMPQYSSSSGQEPAPEATRTVWPSPPPRPEAPKVNPEAAPTQSTTARAIVSNWPTSSHPATGESASWREASPAAWLKRKRSEPESTTTETEQSSGRPPGTASDGE